MKKYNYIISILFFTVTSCKKFIEVAPPKSDLVTATVFANNKTATAALLNIYAQMVNIGAFSGDNTSITTLTGASSDEFTNYSVDPGLSEFYQNALIATNSVVEVRLWDYPYKFIYQANAVIEGVTQSTGVSANVKKQLIGEAKFIRAFSNFYLVNLFGDIPLVTTTEYEKNINLIRTSKLNVYKQVIDDLKDAQSLLNNNYVASNDTVTTNERIRPNKWTATALLARVYLYTENWVDADAQSSALINNINNYSLEDDLNQVFLKNSKEAIWELQPNNPGYNTKEGFTFIFWLGPPPAYDITPYSLSPSLLNSFEPGDQRRTKWVDSLISGTDIYYNPFKYKVYLNSIVSEYSVVLRLAEQYLIRAEARIQQGNIEAGITDLNVLRSRARGSNINDLPNLSTALTKSAALAAMEHERQVELFAEWGHRWFDLKREPGFRNGNISRADEVMPSITVVKGGTWNANCKLYPIPQIQLDRAPNMKGQQNPGYQ